MKKITPNVYVETKCIGANTGFVITSEGIVMIDSPWKPSDAIHQRTSIINHGDIRYLINTEHHIDHFAGNFFFPGIVISHFDTRKEIEAYPLQKVKERILGIAPDEGGLLEGYQVKVPTVTFSKQLNLYLDDYSFELIHIPGHTTGQIAIHIPKERVIFTGDTVSYKVQLWMHDSEPFQWLESLKKIDAIDVDIVVPSHGEICDKGYIPELSAFIQEWIDKVREAIMQGLSKEEAIKRISFLDRYPMDVGLEARGPEIQRWNVSRLYDILKNKIK